ncbi:MAG: DNA helicase UvrD, partial [Gammaproteobacteria bacterium]
MNADARARKEALDPRRSFIVQAPAGSGKTELLIQRFLVLLAGVENPEEVVAITFTRKAAEEMRSRILDALGKAEGEEPEAPHEKTTWRLARAVKERDRQKGWSLEDYPARLRIHTIDALCAALTRQMPVLSSFGSPPEPTESPGELYREAASRTLEELEQHTPWSEHVARLLTHLDNRLENAETLIAEMLAKRDQWIRHVVHVPPRRALEEALEHLIADALHEVGSLFPPEALAAMVDIAKGTKAPLPGPSRGLAFWKAAATFLLNEQGRWRRQVSKRQGFPPGAKEAKARFQALIETLREVPGLQEKLAWLRRLPSGYDAAQWDLLETLCQLLPRSVAQLWEVFRERRQVDFTEVAQRALQALGSEEAPTDLLLSLDYRIRHILVDEFQDTSISQFELLRMLTAGWEPGDGRTLFLVGDPMQSIYRFRDAEVGLFLKAAREGLGAIPLERLTLTLNFRSQKGLVAWFNAAFSQAFPEAEDIALGAVPYVPCEARLEALEGEAVTFDAFQEKDFEGEAERVVARVKEGLEAGSVAILVRNRAHLSAILPALRREGIPYQGVDIEPLIERPVIQDLIALTQALTHPAHRLAWLSILRAPWCGLTLRDLCALAEGDKEAPLASLMEAEECLSRLSAEGRRRLARVRDVLQGALEQRRRLPLRRLVEGTWMALGGPACVEGETDLEDARVFFQQLEALDAGGDLPDPQALPEKLSGLYASPDVEADGSLQIMTIHKAKGLEFDTVILPGLGRRPKNEKDPLLRWFERPRPHGESDLILSPLKKEDEVYRYIKMLDQEKNHLENGRLLYVAATRARKRLHLLGHAGGKAPDRRTLLHPIWPLVRERFAAPIP